LRGVVSNRIFNLKDRKLLEGRILRLRVGITKAVHHKNNEDKNAAIKLLRIDLNGIYHVFREHKNCAKYFCKGENENNEQNLIKEISGDFLNRIIYIARYTADQ
jgi:transposase